MLTINISDIDSFNSIKAQLFKVIKNNMTPFLYQEKTYFYDKLQCQLNANLIRVKPDEYRVGIKNKRQGAIATSYVSVKLNTP